MGNDEAVALFGRDLTRRQREVLTLLRNGKRVYLSARRGQPEDLLGAPRCAARRTLDRLVELKLARWADANLVVPYVESNEDTASSASRQHFIDTGFYLPLGGAESLCPGAVVALVGDRTPASYEFGDYRGWVELSAGDGTFVRNLDAAEVKAATVAWDRDCDVADYDRRGVVEDVAGCSCTPDPDTGDLYDEDGWPCPHG